MYNLLYRRLVEVLEHFTESPQLENSLEVEGCPFALTDVFFALNSIP